MTLTSEPRKSLLALLATLVVGHGGALAQDATYEFDGHTKERLLGQSFPDNSVYQSIAGSSSLDVEADLRLKFSASKGEWSFDSAYQLFAGYGELVNPAGLLPGSPFVRQPSDARRLFNLTTTIDAGEKHLALHRLDRLWVGYANEKSVLRFGRQALSWGNGLIFSPMDIVNPFDPTAVDTEYKVGDDMLYAQYLQNRGNDLQFAYVARRDVVSGDPAFAESTAAVKYHGIAGASEYDLLVARNYGETTFGIGGNRSIGGAVWRGDLVVTDAASGLKTQLVTNLSYAWGWRGKNVSGVIEYYFDGYGLPDGHYEFASLAGNPELLQRLVRGQAFTLGRHYLGGGLMIEMTPLWILAPNLYTNIEDSSALLQIVTRNNLRDDMEFIGALNLPLGPSGSEYGGIALDTAGVFLATDLSLYAQLAWYF